MVLIFSFLFILVAINVLHNIKPDPQIRVIRSIFSLKKIKPKRVANINLVKSKGIRFVNFSILMDFVQNNFLK